MQFKDSFKYRSAWLGIAMLLIIFFHSGLICSKEIYYLKLIGYSGTDIFVFAAGLGSYFSYIKDFSPTCYLKRRLIRIYKTYTPFIICWLIIKISLNHLETNCILGNLFGIQHLINNNTAFNWYITCILLFYILTPILADFIFHNSLLINCILFVTSIIISFAFWNNFILIVIAARLPIYILGMVVAKYQNTSISKATWLILFLSFLLGLAIFYYSYFNYFSILWSHALYWYPFILVVPFSCLLISYISKYAETSKVLMPILTCITTIGDSSFEVYLVHIFVFDISNIYLSRHPEKSFGNIIWASLCLLSIILALAYKQTLNCSYNYIVKKRRNT